MDQKQLTSSDIMDVKKLEEAEVVSPIVSSSIASNTAYEQTTISWDCLTLIYKSKFTATHQGHNDHPLGLYPLIDFMTLCT